MPATTTTEIAANESLDSNLDLTLVITDPNILLYLSPFESVEAKTEKAMEALKVGVIAIQSASPTLDTRVVQAKFGEVEARLKEYAEEFQGEITDQLKEYFKAGDGVIPRSIDTAFGPEGSLAKTMHGFFDPTGGRVSKLLQAQIGPESTFGRALDPRNKDGILSSIEAKVEKLVEAKLDEVLEQFSLDADGSAMSRLKGMLTESLDHLKQSLGVQAATAAEAAKGHVKGIEFEKDLYTPFAEIGRQLGDETELVRGVFGKSRKKTGDYTATLGEISGAPGLTLVVEAKDQPVKLKDAIDELKTAKENREAIIGIFAFAKGAEPDEIGDFRRIGEDFYCTVDKDHLRDGKPLMFFECAYKVARVLAIAAARKGEAGQIDLQKIEDHVNAVLSWSERMTDVATKARTIQKSGNDIETFANSMKADMDKRLSEVLQMLRSGATPAEVPAWPDTTLRTSPNIPAASQHPG